MYMFRMERIYFFEVVTIIRWLERKKCVEHGEIVCAAPCL